MTQAILSTHLNKLPGEGIRELIGEKLTDATVSLYNFICERLPPTPSRFHYVFNLRDISRGVCPVLDEGAICQRMRALCLTCATFPGVRVCLWAGLLEGTLQACTQGPALGVVQTPFRLGGSACLSMPVHACESMCAHACPCVSMCVYACMSMRVHACPCVSMCVYACMSMRV